MSLSVSGIRCYIVRKSLGSAFSIFLWCLKIVMYLQGDIFHKVDCVRCDVPVYRVYGPNYALHFQRLNTNH